MFIVLVFALTCVREDMGLDRRQDSPYLQLQHQVPPRQRLRPQAAQLNGMLKTHPQRQPLLDISHQLHRRRQSQFLTK
jgi:hypothetical protein